MHHGPEAPCYEKFRLPEVSGTAALAKANEPAWRAGVAARAGVIASPNRGRARKPGASGRATLLNRRARRRTPSRAQLMVIQAVAIGKFVSTIKCDGAK